MKRVYEGIAILGVLLGLWLALRPAFVSHEHPGRVIQATWYQQLQQVENGTTSQIVLPDVRVQARWLTGLNSVAPRITELNLAGDDLGTEISALTQCNHLRILHLRTEIGDAELRALASLPELEVLDLPLATGVTDAGLKSLEGHPTLKLVRLRTPGVTDDGLESFARMPALKWLHLMETPLTDAGLKVFRSMPKLESLYLDGDRATDDGLSDLVLARPDLHFHRDQVHLPTDPRIKDGHQD